MAFAISTGLIGPPEIKESVQSVAPAGFIGPSEIKGSIQSASPATATGNPFLDLMDKGFNDAYRPTMWVTENFSPTFITSGDPCLDFFFQVVPDTPAGKVANLLADAWNHDAATALKLVAQLRGVRGNGKSNREGFYSSALWLHKHHKKTLALNVAQFAEFGYLKDMPEILHRLIAGADVREKAKAGRTPRQRGGKVRRRVKLGGRRRKTPAERIKMNSNNKMTSAERIAADIEKGKVFSAEAAKLRRKNRVEMWRRAVARYSSDPDYKFLHDRVADAFAGLLAGDIKNLAAGRLNKISLAAKWCPSIDSSYDRSTLLCEAVARRLFPQSSDSEYSSIAEAHYAYRIRDRLRREVLVPLRRALELPEVYMSANQWSILPYNRVASVAMKNYKEHFVKHDKERFEQYLESVKEGKAKIAAGALLPHEIIADAGDEVAELQWKRMVADLVVNGTLQNCIAVCDVSGSMCGTPMEVCVALGLLISELSEEPWKGRVITFSADPQIHRIEGDSLVEKTEFIRRMDWGMNTNFQRVFDKMLEVAVQGKLAPEQMVKRVFVFSDMEFDVASEHPWATDYEVICRKYRDNGYGGTIPEIVFWNLRDSRSVPVPSMAKGVALVSGFSKNLMKLFLDGKDSTSPRSVMEKAINGKAYENLAVFD